MIKSFFFIFLIVLFSGKAFAQLPTKHKMGELPQFKSYNTIQVLNGSTTTSMGVFSVNGIQSKRIFIGLGLGYDYYYLRSIPLFLEARYNLAGKVRKVQVFANGGANFAVKQSNKLFENKTGPYKIGRYWSTGFDYYVPIKSFAFTLGLAYSTKQIIQMVDSYSWNPTLGRIDNIPIKEDYGLNRIAIRMGWMF